MWIPVTPGSELALAGATVLLNLSGSPITIGRALSRDALMSIDVSPLPCGLRLRRRRREQSTTDSAWDGQTSIFENGTLLAEGERFRQGGQITFADVDLDLLRQERASMGTFHDNRSNKTNGNSYRNIQFSLAPPEEDIGFDWRWNAFRSCRAMRAGLSRIATKHTTFKSLVLCSVCARSDRKRW